MNRSSNDKANWTIDASFLSTSDFWPFRHSIFTSYPHSLPFHSEFFKHWQRPLTMDCWTVTGHN